MDDKDVIDEDEPEGKKQHCIESMLPTVLTKYTSPITEETIVLVLVTLPSGVQKCNPSLDKTCVSCYNGDTNKLVINYTWGDFSFIPEKHYCTDIAKGILQVAHPKIVAIKRKLKEIRSSLCQVPESHVDITLSIQVQVADDKWNNRYITNIDGFWVYYANT
eukprot:8653779-Ditylum_brightwellii.AAC.1